MAETKLKKEFKESDVQRLRNIITKKYGNSTVAQIGYEKQTEERLEGDVWEESNKTWTIKDGIKQTVTKLDKIKKAMRMPFCCPTCNKPMKNALDKRFYPIKGECFDCVVKMETKLKLEGNYGNYSKNIITSNIITHIEEAEQFIEEFINSSNESYITEQGDVEDWDGGVDKNKMINNWKDELSEMKDKLKT